jgi:DNA invertase Pin-like site-specific DNA recombinase
MTDYGFIRISTGSQDAQTQERDIRKASPDAVIIRTDSKAASASKGEQLDALDGLIARLRRGDRVIVTESSRLDRDPDKWAQMARLVQIKATGASVLALSNPAFGSDEDTGVITSAVDQMVNARKSQEVRDGTWRGVQSIIANRGHYGPVPMLWATRGERYSKEAYCTDHDAVAAIYEAVADGESLQSIANCYGVWPQQIKNLIRFEASHTGVIRCAYTYDGETAKWAHKVTPVIASPLWWRANKVLGANATTARANKGGRPVGQAVNWVSGVFACPDCGGSLFVNAGRTPAGNARTPKLRCGGFAKTRKACGQFKGMPVAPVITALDGLFAGDDTGLLAYQRVTGNAHLLDEMKAALARLQAQLSATDDDDELDALVARRKALRGEISAFQMVPDSFDYAPVGDGPKTVAELWASSDDAKRKVVKAARWPLGLMITDDGLEISPAPELLGPGVVDLGDGVCFKAG